MAIFLFLVFFLIPALTEASSKSIRLELVHRHDPLLRGRLPGLPQSANERLRDIVRNDELRQHWIWSVLAQARSHRRRANEVLDSNITFRMPVASGLYTGAGAYFTIFQVGRPAQKLLVTIDTGSDLTWMKCRYRHPISSLESQVHENSSGRVFRADDSRSFTPITCSSKLCLESLPFVLDICPTPDSPCTYAYRYGGGAVTEGFFAYESSTIFLSNDRKTKLKGIVVGCSLNFPDDVADGILGLGSSWFSFASSAMKRYGKGFSYCLVSLYRERNVTSHLTFGISPDPNRSMTYTKLIMPSEALVPFYFIDVQGISVGGVLLNIPSMVWDVEREGGVMIDSGMTLTKLAEPAYVPVITAFKEALKAFEEVPLDPSRFCFKPTRDYTDDLVPKFVLHLGGSAKFEPPCGNYILSAPEDVICLGFSRAPWPSASTIGNVLQQEHLWEFDFTNMRLGFSPSTCVSD